MAGIRAEFTIGVNKRSLDRAAAEVNRVMGGLGKKGVNFSINDRSFTQPLGRITGAANEFTKSLEASNARVIAFGASVGIINTIQNAFKALVIETIEFEKTLGDVNVILNQSSQSLERFGAGLFDVAKNTAQSFNVAAEAALEFSRQGLSMQEVLKRTNDALMLTRLTSLKAAEAVKGLTAAVNAFSDIGLTTTQVIDKLAAVDVKFAVSSEDLIHALGRTGAVAIDAGVSLDSLIGIITSLQQTTARGGAVIGNGLKTIFTRIQRPEALNQLQQLDIQVKNLSGSVLPADLILRNMAKTFDTLTQSQQSNLVQFSAGIFQANIFRGILRDLSKEQGIATQATNVSANAAGEAALKNEKLNKTLSAMASQTGTALRELAGVMGDLMIKPEIGSWLGFFQQSIEGLTNMLGGGEKKGSTFAKGLVRGIGNILTGPTAMAFGAIFLKLFINIAKFAGSSMKDVLGLVSKKDKIRQMEEAIVDALSRNKNLQIGLNNLEGDRRAQEAFILKIIEAQTNAMRQQTQLAKRLAQPMVRAGVQSDFTVPAAMNGPVDLDGDGVADVAPIGARGVIPRGARRRERREASKGGYAAGPIDSMNIKGVGPVVYNKAEKVKQFPGMQQPAIMPPKQSRAGKTYRQAFGTRHGFDPYAGGGFIPNFTSVQGTQLMLDHSPVGLWARPGEVKGSTELKELFETIQRGETGIRTLSATPKQLIRDRGKGGHITKNLVETIQFLESKGITDVKRPFEISNFKWIGDKGIDPTEAATIKELNKQIKGRGVPRYSTTGPPGGDSTFPVDAFGLGLKPIEVKSGSWSQADVIMKSLRMYSDDSLLSFMLQQWPDADSVVAGQRAEKLKKSGSLLVKKGILQEGLDPTSEVLAHRLSRGFVPNFSVQRNRTPAGGGSNEISDEEFIAFGAQKTDGTYYALDEKEGIRKILQNSGTIHDSARSRSGKGGVAISRKNLAMVHNMNRIHWMLTQPADHYQNLMGQADLRKLDGTTQTRVQPIEKFINEKSADPTRTDFPFMPAQQLLIDNGLMAPGDIAAAKTAIAKKSTTQVKDKRQGNYRKGFDFEKYIADTYGGKMQGGNPPIDFTPETGGLPSGPRRGALGTSGGDMAEGTGMGGMLVDATTIQRGHGGPYMANKALSYFLQRGYLSAEDLISEVTALPPGGNLLINDLVSPSRKIREAVFGTNDQVAPLTNNRYQIDNILENLALGQQRGTRWSGILKGMGGNLGTGVHGKTFSISHGLDAVLPPTASFDPQNPDYQKALGFIPNFFDDEIDERGMEYVLAAEDPEGNLENASLMARAAYLKKYGHGGDDHKLKTLIDDTFAAEIAGKKYLHHKNTTDKALLAEGISRDMSLSSITGVGGISEKDIDNAARALTKGYEMGQGDGFIPNFGGLFLPKASKVTSDPNRPTSKKIKALGDGDTAVGSAKFSDLPNVITPKGAGRALMMQGIENLGEIKGGGAMAFSSIVEYARENEIDYILSDGIREQHKWANLNGRGGTNWGKVLQQYPQLRYRLQPGLKTSLDAGFDWRIGKNAQGIETIGTNDENYTSLTNLKHFVDTGIGDQHSIMMSSVSNLDTFVNASGAADGAAYGARGFVPNFAINPMKGDPLEDYNGVVGAQNGMYTMTRVARDGMISLDKTRNKIHQHQLNRYTYDHLKSRRQGKSYRWSTRRPQSPILKGIMDKGPGVKASIRTSSSGGISDTDLWPVSNHAGGTRLQLDDDGKTWMYWPERGGIGKHHQWIIDQLMAEGMSLRQIEREPDYPTPDRYQPKGPGGFLGGRYEAGQAAGFVPNFALRESLEEPGAADDMRGIFGPHMHKRLTDDEKYALCAKAKIKGNKNCMEMIDHFNIGGTKSKAAYEVPQFTERQFPGRPVRNWDPNGPDHHEYRPRPQLPGHQSPRQLSRDRAPRSGSGFIPNFIKDQDPRRNPRVIELIGQLGEITKLMAQIRQGGHDDLLSGDERNIVVGKIKLIMDELESLGVKTPRSNPGLLGKPGAHDVNARGFVPNFARDRRPRDIGSSWEFPREFGGGGEVSQDIESSAEQLMGERRRRDQGPLQVGGTVSSPVAGVITQIKGGKATIALDKGGTRVYNLKDLNQPNKGAGFIPNFIPYQGYYASNDPGGRGKREDQNFGVEKKEPNQIQPTEKQRVLIDTLNKRLKGKMVYVSGETRGQTPEERAEYASRDMESDRQRVVDARLSSAGFVNVLLKDTATRKTRLVDPKKILQNARGFVPNFGNPLREAIGREMGAGIPKSQIRVEQSAQLRGPANPMGLAVTNKRDEPAGIGQGIRRARSQGIDPRKHGAGRGFLPNFADPIESIETLEDAIKKIGSSDAFVTFSDELKDLLTDLVTFVQGVKRLDLGEDEQKEKLTEKNPEIKKLGELVTTRGVDIAAGPGGPASKSQETARQLGALGKALEELTGKIDENAGAQENQEAGMEDGLQKLFFFQSLISMSNGFLQEFAESSDMVTQKMARMGMAISDTIAAHIQQKNIIAEVTRAWGQKATQDDVDEAKAKGKKIAVGDTMQGRSLTDMMGMTGGGGDKKGKSGGKLGGLSSKIGGITKGFTRMLPAIGQAYTAFTFMNSTWAAFSQDGNSLMDLLSSGTTRAAKRIEQLGAVSEKVAASLEDLKVKEENRKKIIELETKGKERSYSDEKELYELRVKQIGLDTKTAKVASDMLVLSDSNIVAEREAGLMFGQLTSQGMETAKALRQIEKSLSTGTLIATVQQGVQKSTNELGGFNWWTDDELADLTATEQKAVRGQIQGGARAIAGGLGEDDARKLAAALEGYEATTDWMGGASAGDFQKRVLGSGIGKVEAAQLAMSPTIMDDKEAMQEWADSLREAADIEAHNVEIAEDRTHSFVESRRLLGEFNTSIELQNMLFSQGIEIDKKRLDVNRKHFDNQNKALTTMQAMSKQRAIELTLQRDLQDITSKEISDRKELDQKYKKERLESIKKVVMGEGKEGGLEMEGMEKKFFTDATTGRMISGGALKLGKELEKAGTHSKEAANVLKNISDDLKNQSKANRHVLDYQNIQVSLLRELNKIQDEKVLIETMEALQAKGILKVNNSLITNLKKGDVLKRAEVNHLIAMGNIDKYEARLKSLETHYQERTITGAAVRLKRIQAQGNVAAAILINMQGELENSRIEADLMRDRTSILLTTNLLLETGAAHAAKKVQDDSLSAMEALAELSVRRRLLRTTRDGLNITAVKFLTDEENARLSSDELIAKSEYLGSLRNTIKLEKIKFQDAKSNLIIEHRAAQAQFLILQTDEDRGDTAAKRLDIEKYTLLTELDNLAEKRKQLDTNVALSETMEKARFLQEQLNATQEAQSTLREAGLPKELVRLRQSTGFIQEKGTAFIGLRDAGMRAQETGRIEDLVAYQNELNQVNDLFGEGQQVMGALRVKLLELDVAAKNFGKDLLNTGFENARSGLVQLFKDISSGAEDADEAWQKFGLGLAKALADRIIEHNVDQIIKNLTYAFTGESAATIEDKINANLERLGTHLEPMDTELKKNTAATLLATKALLLIHKEELLSMVKDDPGSAWDEVAFLIKKLMAGQLSSQEFKDLFGGKGPVSGRDGIIDIMKDEPGAGGYRRGRGSLSDWIEENTQGVDMARIMKDMPKVKYEAFLKGLLPEHVELPGASDIIQDTSEATVATTQKDILKARMHRRNSALGGNVTMEDIATYASGVAPDIGVYNENLTGQQIRWHPSAFGPHGPEASGYPDYEKGWPIQNSLVKLKEDKTRIDADKDYMLHQLTEESRIIKSRADAKKTFESELETKRTILGDKKAQLAASVKASEEYETAMMNPVMRKTLFPQLKEDDAKETLASILKDTVVDQGKYKTQIQTLEQQCGSLEASIDLMLPRQKALDFRDTLDKAIRNMNTFSNALSEQISYFTPSAPVPTTGYPIWNRQSQIHPARKGDVPTTVNSSRVSGNTINFIDLEYEPPKPGTQHFGGKVQHFAKGGLVSGTGFGDTVPAMLTPGELVIPREGVGHMIALIHSMGALSDSMMQTIGIARRADRAMKRNTNERDALGISLRGFNTQVLGAAGTLTALVDIPAARAATNAGHAAALAAEAAQGAAMAAIGAVEAARSASEAVLMMSQAAQGATRELGNASVAVRSLAGAAIQAAGALASIGSAGGGGGGDAPSSGGGDAPSSGGGDAPSSGGGDAGADAFGGKVQHFAKGGFVKGGGSGDSVPAMLTPGEMVIPKGAVDKMYDAGQVRSKNQSPDWMHPDVIGQRDWGQDSKLPTVNESRQTWWDKAKNWGGDFPGPQDGTFKSKFYHGIAGSAQAVTMGLVANEIGKAFKEKQDTPPTFNYNKLNSLDLGSDVSIKRGDARLSSKFLAQDPIMGEYRQYLLDYASYEIQKKNEKQQEKMQTLGSIVGAMNSFVVSQVTGLLAKPMNELITAGKNFVGRTFGEHKSAFKSAEAMGLDVDYKDVSNAMNKHDGVLKVGDNAYQLANAIDSESFLGGRHDSRGQIYDLSDPTHDILKAYDKNGMPYAVKIPGMFKRKDYNDPATYGFSSEKEMIDSGLLEHFEEGGIEARKAIIEFERDKGRMLGESSPAEKAAAIKAEAEQITQLRSTDHKATYWGKKTKNWAAAKSDAQIKDRVREIDRHLVTNNLDGLMSMHPEQKILLAKTNALRRLINLPKYTYDADGNEDFVDFDTKAAGGTVPTMLTAGEAVIPSSIAKRMGYSNLAEINRSGTLPMVEGPGGRDQVGPVGLTPGDFVIRRGSTSKLLNDNPNLMRFAMQNPDGFRKAATGYYEGGLVGEGDMAYSRGTEPVVSQDAGTPVNRLNLLSSTDSTSSMDATGAQRNETTNNININVSIDGSGAEATVEDGDPEARYNREKELSTKIKNAVVEVIRQEKRIGGELN